MDTEKMRAALLYLKKKEAGTDRAAVPHDQSRSLPVMRMVRSVALTGGGTEPERMWVSCHVGQYPVQASGLW